MFSFNTKKYSTKYNTLQSRKRTIIGKFFLWFRIILGLGIAIGGFVLGTWISVYFMFYKGIVAFINGIAFTPSASLIATGIVKVIFAFPLGALVGGIVVAIGAFILFGTEMMRDW